MELLPVLKFITADRVGYGQRVLYSDEYAIVCARSKSCACMQVYDTQYMRHIMQDNLVALLYTPSQSRGIILTVCMDHVHDSVPMISTRCHSNTS